MQISCAFPPGPHVVDHIVEAERLGYERAWLFDSPALYGDIWVIAALAAQRTSRIALGPAVLGDVVDDQGEQPAALRGDQARVDLDVTATPVCHPMALADVDAG